MKTALITGANKGIGFETAKQLAELGYFVYIGSRDKAKGIQATEKLKASELRNALVTNNLVIDEKPTCVTPACLQRT